MPKITDLKIQKSDKTRANLYIDSQFAFGVEMVTVMKLGLKIGQEVSQRQLEEAIFDSEKSVAFGKAVDYLSRGMKTVSQMKTYLEKKGFSLPVVKYVLEKLQEYRYLDDAAYAEAYVRQNSGNKGNRRLRAELVQKGVNREQAEKSADCDSETEQRNASLLAEKYLKNKPCDVKNLQRLQRYLLSRGFEFDTVNAVVRNYRRGQEDD